VYYNAVRGQHGKAYADLTQDPAFAFGFGLTYTEWRLSAPVLAKAVVSVGQSARVDVEVTNEGPRDGVQVVQLYVEDEVTSATWARRELKAWKRIAVAAGQTVNVGLEVKVEDLWIIDAQGRKVVETGRFRILVGTSSRDSDLQETWLTVE